MLNVLLIIELSHHCNFFLKELFTCLEDKHFSISNKDNSKPPFHY